LGSHGVELGLNSYRISLGDTTLFQLVCGFLQHGSSAMHRCDTKRATQTRAHPLLDEVFGCDFP
jgi:hypothetical protein